jgi:hypothetical protein
LITMPTALKRKRRDQAEPVAPEIAAERVALAAAIEAKRKADRAVEEQLAAIHRARALAVSTEDNIAALRSKVSAACESDVKRAASMLKIDKPISSPWAGDNARLGVQRAEEDLRLTEAALKLLHQNMAELQDDAAEAQNSILVCVRQITAPIAQRLVERLDEAKRATLVANRILDTLLDDTGRGLRFADENRSMRADRERAAPLEQIKMQAERLKFGAAPDDDQIAAAHLVSEIKKALAELQHNPEAALPALPPELK